MIFLSILLSIATLFQQAKEKAESSPKWKYPYGELIVQLKKENIQTITLFSYGSLMDLESASKTLQPKSLATRKPALAFGVRRLFDRDVPIKEGSKWCIPVDPEARGMLNIMPTGSPYDFVNGVVLEATVEDLANLLDREQGYDLLPVVIQDWEKENEFRVAYTFYAPQNSSFTSSNIRPRPKYYQLSRDAALQFGPLYYLTWFKTTYLADGKTPIVEWDIKVVQGDKQTQFNCN